MATPRKTSNLPVNYAEQLARESAEIAKRIAAPSGDRIKYNSNRSFITPDGAEGETLEVVVLDFVSANMFYDSPFDRDNPQSPACFAIGPEPSMLVPSTNSPARQAETCSACPNNQFGTAVMGKGKACKNTRLLAMMPVTALDDPDSAPMWVMAVPPTSIKAYDAYVHSLAAKHSTVPVGMITQVSMDSNSQFAAPRFSAIRPLTDKEIGVFMARRDEAINRLNTEPDVSQYQSPAPTKVGAKRR